MATDVDQAYFGWVCEEFPDQGNSQDVSIAQMLDHGSISFGRFAVESLSWEKRSVFTYNQRQEELEKFKAPGLVAQKKAYFEEYYKKLRAQKALQESQQTELTWDCGGDVSISSQTGEEEKAALHVEILRDGEANITNDFSKENKVEVIVEKEIDCSEVLEIGPLDSDVSNLDSSRKNMEKIEQEKKPNNSLEMHHAEAGFLGQKLLVRSIKVVEQNHLSNVEDKKISTIEGNSASNIGSEIAHQGSAHESQIARVRDPKLTPAYNIIQNKTKQTVKKSREAHISVPKAKVLAASVRNDLQLDSKTNLNLIKSSHKAKGLQKSSGKTENSISCGKPPANRVPSNKKSASMASKRPLTEVPSNVTIPRPFSFATGRRAAAPTGTRETATKMDSKTSSRSEPALVLSKSGLTVQVNTKKTAITRSSRGLENRVHEEMRKGPLATESRCNSSTGSAAHAAHMFGTRKARSVNLPPQSKSKFKVGTEKQLTSTAKWDKGKEGKDDARLRVSQGTKTKTTTLLQDTSLRMGNKKTTASQSGVPSLVGRRLRTAELSLDGRKARKEMPRWR